MPSWSDRDREQYEEIKESYEERGKSEDTAQEIAARTVNKHRREEGRTPNETTEGTGNPTEPLDERTKDELYNRAQELDIEGRSKMDKDELIRAIRRPIGFSFPWRRARVARPPGLRAARSFPPADGRRGRGGSSR